jgi:hypothetical protein
MGLWFLILGHSLRRLPAFSGERQHADECPLAGARGYGGSEISDRGSAENTGSGERQQADGLRLVTGQYRKIGGG